MLEGYRESFRGIFYDNDNGIISKAMIESFRPIVMYNIDIRIISSQAHGHGIGLYIYKEIFLKLVITY